MGEFGPLEIVAIVAVVGGLTAFLLEIAVRNPLSFLDMLDDVRSFAEPRRDKAATPAQPEDNGEADAPKGESDDPRMAA